MSYQIDYKPMDLRVDLGGLIAEQPIGYDDIAVLKNLTNETIDHSTLFPIAYAIKNAGVEKLVLDFSDYDDQGELMLSFLEGFLGSSYFELRYVVTDPAKVGGEVILRNRKQRVVETIDEAVLSF